MKAKGLLSQMLSLPDDWDYTLSGLSYINRESKDAIRSAVNELETAGYFLLIGLRKVAGEFALFCLGYNIERAKNLLGFGRMMELMVREAASFLLKCVIYSVFNGTKKEKRLILCAE